MSNYTVRVKDNFVSVMHGTTEAAWFKFSDNKSFDAAYSEAKAVAKKLEADELKRDSKGRFIPKEESAQ